MFSLTEWHTKKHYAVVSSSFDIQCKLKYWKPLLEIKTLLFVQRVIKRKSMFTRQRSSLNSEVRVTCSRWSWSWRSVGVTAWSASGWNCAWRSISAGTTSVTTLGCGWIAWSFWTRLSVTWSCCRFLSGWVRVGTCCTVCGVNSWICQSSALQLVDVKQTKKDRISVWW